MTATNPTIVFFMIVTERDIVIAEFAVRSYARLKNVPFKLVVYSNWIPFDLRQSYFPRWRRLPFLEIWEDASESDTGKPQDRSLEGPFEPGYVIWDRELKKLSDVPFHAVVDADFEILDPVFVDAMLARLRDDPGLVGISAEYNPPVAAFADTYTKRLIELNERWHTSFCIYKREALACRESYVYREEPLPGPVARHVWDDHAYFQQALRREHRYRFDVVDPRFRRCFIHYAAFSKNRDIDEANVALYRRVQILRQHGLFRRGDPVTRFAGHVLNRLLYDRVDRLTFVPGWAQPSADAKHRTRTLPG